MLLIATQSLHQVVEFALVIHVEGIFKNIFEDIDCIVNDFLRSTQATLSTYDGPIPIGYLTPDIFQLRRLTNHLECDILCECNRLLHSICLEERIDNVDPVLSKEL